MKSCRKKVLTAVLVFIICSIVMTVYAEPADIQGHWARHEVNRWIERGILFGDAEGNFKPDDRISRAEFAAVINRIFKYQDRNANAFSDIKGSEWYAADIDKVSTAGVLKGSGGKAMPNASVSRQEAAVMLARAFSLEAADKNAVKGFNDEASIPAWSREALSAMYEKGYISGQPGNVIAPTADTSRAEVVKMLDNIVGGIKSKPGTYTGIIDGNLIVNSADTVLESMVVNGDLYLTQGIGNGSVTFDNVTVKGRTIVNGGGDHSIIIKNSTLTGNLIVLKKDGKIRIVAQGSTDIPTVLMESGGILEESGTTGNGFGNIQSVITVVQGQSIVLNGSFDEVSVEVHGIDVEVAGGSIGNLNIRDNAAGSNIMIAEGALVGTLTIDAAARITGKGTVNTLNINADGVTMEQVPAVINKKDGVTLPSNLEAMLSGVSNQVFSGGGGGSDNEGDGDIDEGDGDGGDNEGDGDIDEGDGDGGDNEGDGDIDEGDGDGGDNEGDGDIDEGNGDGGDNEGDGDIDEGDDDGGDNEGDGNGGGVIIPTDPGDTVVLKVYSAAACIEGLWIEAVEIESGVWEIDLRDKDPVSMFTDLKVNASPDVVKAVVSYMGISRTLNFSNGTATANVHDMLGSLDTGEPGVSILSIKKYGKTEFTVIFKNSSGESKSVLIKLIV